MLLNKKIPMKYVLGKIKYELVLVILYVIAFEVAHSYFEANALNIPIAIPTIIGTIISLLLAFKSNQAYDRWWEARIIWGAIVNDSRTLSRQIVSFIDNPYELDEVEHFKKRFIKRQIAWCNALSQSLRGFKAQNGLERYLEKTELSYIKNQRNVTVALLELHAMDLKKALNEGWINEYQQIEIDKTITALCNHMGGSERIKNTIFPVTYSKYINMSIHLFIVLLPFGLIEYFGYIEVPLVVAIATFFLLVEKMAVHLQDPFENKPTDTPTTTICRNIEKDLCQLIDDHKMYEDMPQVEKASIGSYYIL